MRIHRNILAGVSKVAEKENGRYALANVALFQDGDKCQAVATDSKMMIEASFDSSVNGLASGSLIPASYGAKLAKDLKNKLIDQIILEDHPDRPEMAFRAYLDHHPLTVGMDQGLIESKYGAPIVGGKDDGRFPKYQDVFPNPAALSEPVNINVKLMVQLLEAMEVASGKPNVSIRIPSDAGKYGKPILLESSGHYYGGKKSETIIPGTGADVRGLIMPIETDRDRAKAANEKPWTGRLNEYTPDHLVRRRIANDFPALGGKWIKDEARKAYVWNVNGTELAIVGVDPSDDIRARIDCDSCQCGYELRLSWDKLHEIHPSVPCQEYLREKAAFHELVLNDLLLRIPFEGTRYSL